LEEKTASFVQILTDYRQWYDEIFDGEPPVFERMAFTRGGLSKSAQFGFFKSLLCAVPPHGIVKDLFNHLDSPCLGSTIPKSLAIDIQCVVYLDEYAHRGEGKERMALAEAVTRYPNHYGCLYIPQSGPPLAYRMVRFGDLTFWLRQTGDPSSWQSNRRDHETVLEKQRASQPNPVSRVLWAIDFLPTPFGLLAMDFNTAPELSTLGETGALTVAEVAKELENTFKRNPQQLKQL
jgi:hypothetical protein